MAEKKERTLHIVQKLDGRFAGVSSMTRQEAIERMTVAMCKFDCTDNERACENCNEWEKYDKCESLAEAALNALLEETK